MPQQIRIRRGLEADIPTLADGEPGLTEDVGNQKLFIGTNSGNQLVAAFGGSSARYTVSGTKASPNVITAAGGITAANVARQLIFVKSSGGAVPITANPQISAGTTVGDEIVLLGTSNTDYLVIDDGNGLAANGPKQLKAGSAWYGIWDGTLWSEVPR